MKIASMLTSAALICLVADGLGAPVRAQQPGPPSGVFDIPAGFDFPGDKQTLDQFRSTGNLSGQRAHVWNVFAGMTQATPDGKFAIWETWYSEDETFQAGAAPQAVGPHRVIRRFRQPEQFRAGAGALPQAAGTALFSFVLYNFPAYNHIRSNQLFAAATLNGLQQTGNPDPKVPNNRTVPPFPSNAVSLKTVWWPIAANQVTAIPIWDPELNPVIPSGNDFKTWARVVAVDPTNPNVPPDATTSISLGGKQFPNSHLVGLNAFHFVQVDDQTAANAMTNPTLQNAAQFALGRALQAGDFVVFLGTHLTTKEIDDWVWATFWWHDRPNQGPFAADRPATLKAPWNNYLMSASYDLNLPREADGSPHTTFNPWLEARFRDGTVSNCMNCHNRASYQPVAFLPVKRGDPDFNNDAAFAAGQLRPDFLWSIPINAQ